MMSKLRRGAWIMAVLLPLVSCERRPMDDDVTGTSAIDTTALRSSYAEIDSLHALMMARYGQMEGDAPDAMRRMYGSLQEMHGSAAQMHGAMMHAGGMAGGMDGGMMDGGMMPGGMVGGAMMEMHRAREWDQQMAAMHAQMSAYMRDQGHGDMADLHDDMARRFHGTAEALPAAGGGVAESDAEPAAGDQIYATQCAACHGPNGGGVSGVFPPLAGSEWVTGDAAVPVRILLHGLEGDIDVQGEAYRGTMPAFGARLSDGEIAAVTSYIRSAWGNDATGVAEEDVRQMREEFRSRSEPWESAELR